MSQHKNTLILPSPSKKYRVVQWATGNIGSRAMRAVIEHPNMTLVGVHVHSEAKAGRDAGELCGLGPIGITATRDIDEIIALKPDCVLYMQQGINFDDVCKLLASGANIVTTRNDFHYPAALDPAIRKRVEEACRRGGTSIHSTGSSPGFITEAVPLVLTSIQRRLDSLTIDEFADLSTRNSPDLLFKDVGFGQLPGEFNERMLAHARANFGPTLSLLADALSMPLDKVEVSGEFATARHDTSVAAGTVKAGTVAALRIVTAGIRDGRPLLRMRTNWYFTTDIEPAWNLRGSGWHILVEGDTPLDVSIDFPVSPERYAAFTPGLTAHRPVNAIPFVCAAPPGIQTIVDLPTIIANLG